MKKSSNVRVAVIGTGNMGTYHAKCLFEGKVPGAELAAVCDHNPSKLGGFGDTPKFLNTKDLFRAGGFDAVVIATPHYDHTTIGIEALAKGVHVLVEKPISVHKADCERLIAAYKASGKGRKRPVFAAMFNLRTVPVFIKLRELIHSGEIGEIRRVNWIVTNWFRTYSYYASGGWRATWSGEGGGVLLNQCPHQLDLMQWFFGMPKKVRAFCRFGQYHDIEVEDDVTSYMEFANGATGVFIASTGEAPGTNRLEITAERGRILWDGGDILFHRNEVPMTEFSKTTPGGFTTPPYWKVEIPSSNVGGQHLEVLQNFSDAIREGAKLIAPAEEGIHSVELANAMLLSTFLDKTVDLPLDGKLYERQLKLRIKNSKPRKSSKSVVQSKASSDFASSFAKPGV